MVPFWPLVASLLGLALYLGSPNGKLSEAGRILYFCGLLVFLMKTGAVR